MDKQGVQAYLWFIAASVMASLSEFVLSEGAADEDAVPGPTSGKCCLNEAYSSSAGFCEFLLSENRGVSDVRMQQIERRVLITCTLTGCETLQKVVVRKRVIGDT